MTKIQKFLLQNTALGEKTAYFKNFNFTYHTHIHDNLHKSMYVEEAPQRYCKIKCETLKGVFFQVQIIGIL